MQLGFISYTIVDGVSWSPKELYGLLPALVGPWALGLVLGNWCRYDFLVVSCKCCGSRLSDLQLVPRVILGLDLQSLVPKLQYLAFCWLESSIALSLEGKLGEMGLLLGNKLYLRVDLSRAPEGQLYRIPELLGLLVVAPWLCSCSSIHCIVIFSDS